MGVAVRDFRFFMCLSSRSPRAHVGVPVNCRGPSQRKFLFHPALLTLSIALMVAVLLAGPAPSPHGRVRYRDITTAFVSAQSSSHGKSGSNSKRSFSACLSGIGPSSHW